MPGRTIAIGDIHGCSLALAALIDAIVPGPDDTVVTLGDYVNRGPDSPGVLDQLIALGQRCRLVPLLGNHEEMLLAALRFSLAEDCIAATEEAIPDRHLGFLRGCQDYYETDTHLFVHANYVANLPLDRQPKHSLRWEFLDEGLAMPHCSGKVAVLGHTEQRNGEVLDLGFLLCLDTYCYGGGWLTALEVTNGRVWQTCVTNLASVSSTDPSLAPPGKSD